MNFPDLEKFNQKTVYNYVQKIRREENIPMESEGNNRPYCMLELCYNNKKRYKASRLVRHFTLGAV